MRRIDKLCLLFTSRYTFVRYFNHFRSKLVFFLCVLFNEMFVSNNKTMIILVNDGTALSVLRQFLMFVENYINQT